MLPFGISVAVFIVIAGGAGGGQGGRIKGFERDDALGETARELAGVGADDGLENLDVWEEAVGGCCDGGEFGVLASDAFDAVGGELYALAGPEFGEEDVWIDGFDEAVGFWEVGGLFAGGVEGYLVGVDCCAVRYIFEIWYCVDGGGNDGSGRRVSDCGNWEQVRKKRNLVVLNVRRALNSPLEL